MSEATISRFSKAVGYDGFPSLKLSIAADTTVSRPLPNLPNNISEDDTLGDMREKLLATLTTALKMTGNTVDMDAVEAAAEAISEAKRLIFIGVGGAASICVEAMHLFVKSGRPAETYFDGYTQITAASTLREGDTLVGISHTGQTRSVAHALSIAAKGGASTIAITSDKKIGCRARRQPRLGDLEQSARASAALRRFPRGPHGATVPRGSHLPKHAVQIEERRKGQPPRHGRGVEAVLRHEMSATMTRRPAPHHLLDMDGVLVRGEQPIAGSVEYLAMLRDKKRSLHDPHKQFEVCAERPLRPPRGPGLCRRAGKHLHVGLGHRALRARGRRLALGVSPSATTGYEPRLRRPTASSSTRRRITSSSARALTFTTPIWRRRLP